MTYRKVIEWKDGEVEIKEECHEETREEEQEIKEELELDKKYREHFKIRDNGYPMVK